MHFLLSNIVGVGFILLHFSTANAASLDLTLNLSASNFFAGTQQWTFLNGPDQNNSGNALFQTQQQATEAGLIGANSAGNVIIKADNTTSGVGDPTFGRPSVKISSLFTFSAGQLMVLDLLHIPYGCSVWPAFWTLAASDSQSNGGAWPNGGEIDLIENVNDEMNNQYSLHTTNGCTHPPASANVNETGNLISTDCYNATNGNEGCIVSDPSPNSFGAGFAANGGGVVVSYWSELGLSFYSFNRSSIPVDITSSSPNPDNWPAPTAFYPSSSCNTSEFFSPQNVLFEITMCGVFAGAPSVFNSGGCTGQCQDLVADPSNYNEAYFEIRYLALFSTSNGTNSSSTTSSSTSNITSAGSTTPNSGTAPSLTTSLLTIFLGVAVPVACAFATMALS